MEYYSATYFNRSRIILESREPVEVIMQVFQKDNAILAGMGEVIDLLDAHTSAEIHALSDGDEISPWEPVLTIKGDLAEFVHLESVYLGILARATRVATNMRRVVDAANGKPIVFMGDRFDRYENQRSDGYAAILGGAAEVCTEAMGQGAGKAPVGTMPHALIAAFGGDVVEAGKAFRETFPEIPLTALVDFNNDCVLDSVRCIREFGKDLHAVRLDTSENMVDVGLADAMIHVPEHFGDFKPTGVNPALVHAVRHGLNQNNGEHVKIIVSGGFTPEKIRSFEEGRVPVDAYGVGSSIVKNGGDFTADIVYPVGKAGRRLRPNPRLKKV